MAIALQPRFPIPDRSDQTIRMKKDEAGVIDIGWCDGVLSDGRPFRVEMWAQDGVDMLTIFFSTAGLDQCDDDALQQLVAREELVSFADGPRYCSARKFVDKAGSELWSVNIVVGADQQTFLTGSVPIFPYSRCGEPNTMFNPVPIKAAHARP
jgi:hypothetical protein